MNTYLNLGCGDRFDPAWTNVDCVASDPSILSHDLRKGIPFADESFDVIYHSHLIEHLPKTQLRPFLNDCLRVLKPDGVIRIAAPDLEQIVKEYLHALDAVRAGKEGAGDDYDWIMLELYDQSVREQSGGDMARYLSQEKIPNLSFVLNRIGKEGRKIIEGAAQSRQMATTPPRRSSKIRWLMTLICDSTLRREWLTRRVLGSEYEMLELGRFRRGGEIHQWMYDRYSLSALLLEAGFRSPMVLGPTESHIINWKDFHLDTDADGQVYKPDSIFMEAFK